MSSFSGFLHSLLGQAAKRRCVANPGESSNSDHEETDHVDASLEEIEHPYPRAEDVPDIFLSHSGNQKYLVECLYIALQRTNHTIFFNQETLSKGSRFPPNIKGAAKGCKIGVVVLSEEFLTSKWPMIELEILVLQRSPNPCVLPLFYELSPADLKSPEKLLEWRRVWQEMVGEKNSATKWEQAIKVLSSINGIVYKQGTSIGAYINTVVQCICALLPCYVPYDCSFVQGQPRLVQEIATKFEHSNASQACMVALHGVGGLGKTTLCKVMVNYYCSHYCGKSFLIEFPSPGCGDVSRIVSECCKKALKKLTDASYEHLLNEADDFDQVVQLMRDRVGRHDVFLAIDNVWESSLEVAKRVLWVGFSANSKILVTSRSEEVLKDLLMVEGLVNNANVAPLPAPEREAAFQIFQETFKPHDLSALVDRTQVDKLLGRCRFSGSYHALALKALAKYIKTVCKAADLEGIKHRLSWVLKEISHKNLSDLEKVVRLSYDILDEQKKDIFLDIVVLLQEERFDDLRWFDNLHQPKIWDRIGFLYWMLPKSETTRLINELSLDGLIQTEVDGSGTTSIQVHDLYWELGLKEVASSPRFLIEGSTESVKKIEWEKLESVILNDDEPGLSLIKELQQRNCPELKCLMAFGIKIESGIWLGSKPSLSVLTLEHIRLVESDSKREDVEQPHLLQLFEQVPGMLSLDQEGTIENGRTGFGRVKGLVDASRIVRLNGLVKLRELKVCRCYFVQEIAGLHTLRNLQWLTIYKCYELEIINGLSSLTCLERLFLSSNRGMKEIGGLSCTLKDVKVEGCVVLKRMPDMSSLTCLEKLKLVDNNAMEEIEGLSCTLKNVKVEGSAHLKRMPDMSSLTCLQRLELVNNEVMEEVGGKYLSSTLKRLCITGCESLRSCPRLDQCMHLETWETGYAHHVSSIQKLTNVHMCLQHLTIDGSDGGSSIRKIDVECLINLKGLSVFSCEALEEIGDLSALHSLKSLCIKECPKLKKLNVHSLKSLRIKECPRLKKLNVGCLEELELSYCRALEEVIGDNWKVLKELEIESCQGLKKVGGHLIDPPPLFEGIADLRALCSLEYLKIKGDIINGWPSLKKLNVGCLSLKSVKVHTCKALVEITGDNLKALRYLYIYECESLERVGGILLDYPPPYMTLADVIELSEKREISTC